MGLIGENGAGKTTIINLITGAVKKSGGKIKIFGKDSEGLSEDDFALIGTVLADCSFPEEMNVSMAEKVFSGLYKNWEQGEILRLYGKIRPAFKEKNKDIFNGYENEA